MQTAIENNVNLKVLNIAAYPLPTFSFYVIINFDTAIKFGNMYMTLEQFKKNVKTHYSASKDYIKTITNK
jgi:5-methylthioribose kinase